MRECEVCGADAFEPLAVDAGYAWEHCRSCGFVRLRDLLTPAAAAAGEDSCWEQYTADYERKFTSKMRRSRRRARRIWRRRPGGRFLDVGSNYGFMVEAAAECGFDPIGIDISAGLVRAARARFPGRDFRAGALEDQDFGGARFDCVYCSEVIEHTVDPRIFARGMAAAMSPGALLYLTTPHVREYARRGWRAMAAPDHKMYFTEDTIERLLRAAGFTDIKQEFTFRRGIKLWAVRG